MANNFPASTNNLTGNETLASWDHAGEHNALESKVGIDNSADTNSIDYKLNHLLTSSVTAVTDKNYVTDVQLTAIGTIPVKATGAEITTGTNDTKFTTPKALADAGIVLDTTVTLGTSDVKIPTQKAVKTYVDNNIGITISAASYTTDTGTSLTVSTKNTYFLITAQAGALKFNNPGGTPTDGWKLWIAVTGTAARALTYDTQFEASAAVALPTTTVTTARLDIGFIWRADTSKWRCIASS